MANIIKTKQSSTALDVPTAGQLEQGELAINIADEKLYSKNSSDAIFELGINIDDGVGTSQPIGYNTMPIYEIDAADTFDLAHASMLWHKDAGGAISFTCAVDGTIPLGSTWVVFNDDTEDLTIAQSGTTIYWLEAGAAPTSGNVTVEQGGIVTVYKYSSSEYWAWGTKEAAPEPVVSLDDLTDVVITSSATGDILRYNGTSYVDYPDSNYESALGNPGTNGYVLSSLIIGSRSWIHVEDHLGTPGGNGYILSSTTGNVRSWIANTAATELDGLSDVTLTSPASASILINNGSGQFVDQVPYNDISMSTAGYVTLLAAAITGKPAAGTLISTDDFLVSDGGVLSQCNLSSIGTWMQNNLDFSAGAYNLDDLGDVIITTANSGDVLRYNGSNWVDYPDSNYATSGHQHTTFDRASSVLSGANVFSNIVVTDGITTAIATRAMSINDLGGPYTNNAGTVTGTGTNNYIAVWNGTTGIDAGSSFLITDALDKTATSNTLTGELRLSRTVPKFELYETDAASNEKLYDFRMASGDLALRTRTDADGAGVTIFNVSRGTGTAVDSLDITVPVNVDDGLSASQPVGYNTMPIYEIDAADTFDLAHVGMMWHKDAGGAVTFTCANDGTIPIGATWVVFNDDTENVTIAQSSTTILWLEAGGAPASGNVTVEQGGIVTVYKYAAAEYWVWGSKALGSATIPTQITISDESSDTSCYLMFATAATGDILPKSGTNLTFNSSSGLLSSTAHTCTGDMTADNFEATGLGPLSTPGTDDLYMGGYGIIGYRNAGTLYVTNAGTSTSSIVSLATGGNHGAAQVRLKAWEENVDGRTSSVQINDHQGTSRDVGFNNQTEFSLATTTPATLDDLHVGRVIRMNGAGSRTVTMAASSTQFPIGSMCTVLNHCTSGTQTISDGSEAMYIMDGSGTITDSTGFTLAVGGVVNIWRQGTSAYYVWGAGIP